MNHILQPALQFQWQESNWVAGLGSEGRGQGSRPVYGRWSGKEGGQESSWEMGELAHHSG